MKTLLPFCVAFSCAFSLTSCEGVAISGSIYTDFGTVTYDDQTRTINAELDAQALGREIFDDK